MCRRWWCSSRRNHHKDKFLDSSRQVGSLLNIQYQVLVLFLQCTLDMMDHSILPVVQDSIQCSVHQNSFLQSNFQRGHTHLVHHISVILVCCFYLVYRQRQNLSESKTRKIARIIPAEIAAFASSELGRNGLIAKTQVLLSPWKQKIVETA